jgi:hypothetical protein
MFGSAEGRTSPVRLVSGRETELYIVDNFRSFNELRLYYLTRTTRFSVDKSHKLVHIVHG